MEGTPNSIQSLQPSNLSSSTSNTATSLSTLNTLDSLAQNTLPPKLPLTPSPPNPPHASSSNTSTKTMTSASSYSCQPNDTKNTFNDPSNAPSTTASTTNTTTLIPTLSKSSSFTSPPSLLSHSTDTLSFLLPQTPLPNRQRRPSLPFKPPTLRKLNPSTSFLHHSNPFNLPSSSPPPPSSSSSSSLYHPSSTRIRQTSLSSIPSSPPPEESSFYSMKNTTLSSDLFPSSSSSTSSSSSLSSPTHTSFDASHSHTTLTAFNFAKKMHSFSSNSTHAAAAASSGIILKRHSIHTDARKETPSTPCRPRYGVNSFYASHQYRMSPSASRHSFSSGGSSSFSFLSNSNSNSASTSTSNSNSTPTSSDSEHRRRFSSPNLNLSKDSHKRKSSSTITYPKKYSRQRERNPRPSTTLMEANEDLNLEDVDDRLALSSASPLASLSHPPPPSSLPRSPSLPSISTTATTQATMTTTSSSSATTPSSSSSSAFVMVDPKLMTDPLSEDTTLLLEDTSALDPPSLIIDTPTHHPSPNPSTKRRPSFRFSSSSSSSTSTALSPLCSPLNPFLNDPIPPPSLRSIPSTPDEKKKALLPVAPSSHGSPLKNTPLTTSSPFTPSPTSATSRHVSSISLAPSLQTPPPPTTSPTLLTPSHLPLPSSTSSLSSPSLLLLQHPPPFTHPRSPSNDMTQSLSRLPSPRSDPGLLPLTSWSPPSMLCLEDEDKDGEGEEEEEEEEEEEDEEDGDQGNGSEILFTPLHSACHPVMSKWKSRRSQKTRRKKNNGSYRLPFTFPSTNVDPPPPPPPHSHGKPTKEEQKEGLLKLKNLPLNEFPLPPTTEVQETTQKKHLLLSTPHGTKSPITISSSQVLHGNTPEPFVFHPIHLLQHHRPLSPPPPMLFLSSLHALRFTFPHFLTLDYFDTQFPALPTPPTLTSSSSSVSKPRSSKSASSIRLPSRTSVPSPFKTSSFTKKIRSTETETKTGNEEKEEKKNMPPSLLPFQQKTKNDGSLSLRHRPLSMSISKDSYYFRKNKDKEEDEDVDEAPDYFHTHFEDIEEHGTGSFSTVYHVRRIEDGRKMAVKQLKVPYVSLADRQQKLKEVHVWLQLPKHHPHLLGLELAWEQSGFVYMLMEYAPMDLNMYLHYRASSPYQEEEVWDLMHDVVHGLAKLHALGWIHLDLKPANILVRSLDPLMYQIADFSLTSSLQEVKGGGEGRGAPQVMEGDAKYLAPEALLHHQFGTFTDMYAVGLIMLETMSNAELPNKGDLYDRLRRGCIDDYMPFLLGFSNGCCGCVLHCINPTPWCRPSALHWCLECPPILQAVQRRGPRYFNVLQAIPSNEDLLGPCTSPFNPPSKPPRSPVPPHSSS